MENNLPHTKECIDCHQVLPVESFPLSRAEFRRPRCTDCYNAYRRELRNLNPDRVKNHRLANKRYRRENIEKDIISRTRRRAEKKGFEFNITESDIVVPTHCPLLGIKLEVGRDKDGYVHSSPSIDRIDSTKGYVKGNIWIISNRANQIKSDATLEELQLITKNLRKKLKKEKNT